MRSSFVRCPLLPPDILKTFSQRYNDRNGAISANLKNPLKSILIQIVTTVYRELTMFYGHFLVVPTRTT